MTDNQQEKQTREAAVVFGLGDQLELYEMSLKLGEALYMWEDTPIEPKMDHTPHIVDPQGRLVPWIPRTLDQ